MSAPTVLLPLISVVNDPQIVMNGQWINVDEQQKLS